MAERIVLKEPGRELVMLVKSVKAEVVERNEYYLFGNGQVETLVPQSSVKGRFERLEITDVQQMVGRAVRLARSTKMSRAGAPYWDIDWASGDDTTNIGKSSGAENGSAGGGGNAGNPASAPPAEGSPEKPKLSDIYLKATEFVIDKVLPKYVAAGIGVSDTAIVAAVATLFIAASKER